MEQYSENPSGKVKGLGFIAFILFILIVVGGYYFFYKEEFKTIVDEIKSIYGDNYVNYLNKYIEEEGIIIEEWDNIVVDSSKFQSTEYINGYYYEFNFSRSMNNLKIKSNDWSNTVDVTPREDDEWYSITVKKYYNGFLVELEGVTYNTYLFISKDLNIELSVETPEMYQPILSDENKIYFAHESEYSVDIYEYDCMTAKYNLIKSN